MDYKSVKKSRSSGVYVVGYSSLPFINYKQRVILTHTPNKTYEKLLTILKTNFLSTGTLNHQTTSLFCAN